MTTRTTFLAVAIGLVLVLPGAATAQTNCSVSGTTLEIVIAPGETAVVRVGSGGAILLNDSTCADASTSSIDLIDVTGGTASEMFVIDLSGGPFAPGASPDEHGDAEIEFAVDLGPGADDALSVRGSAGAEQIRVDSPGRIDLNGDIDNDVGIPAGVEILDFALAAGDDFVNADSYLFIPIIANGGAGDDRLIPGDADDVIQGGPGNDRVQGGNFFDDGDDTVLGGGGNDSLQGGHGDDELVGGLGSDTVDYSQTQWDRVVVDLRSGTATSADQGADTVTGIENVIGTIFSDSLKGSAARNILNGGGWGWEDSDQLVGRGGPDRLVGGTGTDYLSGGRGRDRLLGGPGGDELNGGADRDTCLGGDGFDVQVYCERWVQ